MIRIDFSKHDVEALRYQRFHHPSARVQQKIEAIYLKSKGLPHHEICRLCEISKTTLISYLREYKAGGLKKLTEATKYKGKTRRVIGTTMGLSAYLN